MNKMRVLLYVGVFRTLLYVGVFLVVTSWVAASIVVTVEQSRDNINNIGKY